MEVVQTLLVSTMCGATFVGGGVLVVVIIALFAPIRKGSLDDAVKANWEVQNELHEQQIAVFGRLCKAVEALKPPPPVCPA